MISRDTILGILVDGGGKRGKRGASCLRSDIFFLLTGVLPQAVKTAGKRANQRGIKCLVGVSSHISKSS